MILPKLPPDHSPPLFVLLGDLVYVRTFGTGYLFVNSYEAAVELFEKRGNNYSSRPQTTMLNLYVILLVNGRHKNKPVDNIDFKVKDGTSGLLQLCRMETNFERLGNTSTCSSRNPLPRTTLTFN